MGHCRWRGSACIVRRMSAFLPHIVRRLALVALVPLVVTACDPNMRGGSPVVRGRPPAGCAGSVTVYSGDTVYSIARRCNVSVRELIEANRIRAPYVIYPGQALRVPGGSGEYVVRRGDTLLVLARRLGVDFQTLARTNGKTPPYTIYVGETLRVPGAYNGGTVAGRDSNGGTLVIASPNASGSHAPSRGSTTIMSRLPDSGSSGKDAQSAPPPSSSSTPSGPQTRTSQQQASLPPPPPPPMAGKGFVWPVRGEMLAEFGPMAKGQHNDGVNIAAPRGTPVIAAENGVVAYVGNELKGFGNLLLIKHADGWMTAYAHNDHLLVGKGDQVRRGQQIATVGASGNVTQPQLHFELRRGTQAVNPFDYIKADMVSRLLSSTGLDQG